MSSWNLGVDVVPTTTNTYKLGDSDHKFILNGYTHGVAPLDENGKVSSDYLPSYVDNIVEYATVDNFPVTGSTGVIYIALDTNFCYRWSGSVYVQIAGGEFATNADIDALFT